MKFRVPQGYDTLTLSHNFWLSDIIVCADMYSFEKFERYMSCSCIDVFFSNPTFVRFQANSRLVQISHLNTV